MNKNKELLKKLLTAIERTATELDVHPTQLTKAGLMEHSNITDWELRKFGGLASLKKRFPMTEKVHVEIQRQKELASYVNSLEKQLGESVLNEERMVNALQKVVPVHILPYKPKKREPLSRELNLILSDLHIGSDISKTETGKLDFGKTEEARRLARVVKEVVGYKTEHRDKTRLNVLLLGDIIQNQLHDARDGAPLAEQAVRAINLLNQVVAQFSANFKEVRVFCNTGNHGRNTTRHVDRSINQKWDSVETIIYYAIKESCKSLKNVKIVIPKTPYVEYEVFGKKVFATHGDTVLKPGYPGKSIQTGSLENQINRINASLKDNNEYSVIVVGHVHIASVTHLSNGSALVTNGALVPVDEYAVSIGMMEAANGQYLFESVEGFPVGDCRFIKVSEVDDMNKELDGVIQSFKEL